MPENTNEDDIEVGDLVKISLSDVPLSERNARALGSWSGVIFFVKSILDGKAKVAALLSGKFAGVELNDINLSWLILVSRKAKV